MTISKINVRQGKAVVDVKGETAEGKSLPLFSGHSDNIRLTVAYAESYVLIRDVPEAGGQFV